MNNNIILYRLQQEKPKSRKQKHIWNLLQSSYRKSKNEFFISFLLEKMKMTWKSTPPIGGMEKSNFLPRTDEIKWNCNVLVFSHGPDVKDWHPTQSWDSIAASSKVSNCAVADWHRTLLKLLNSLLSGKECCSSPNIRWWYCHKVPVRKRGDILSTEQGRADGTQKF